MGIEPIPMNKAPAAKDFTSKMEGMLENVRKILEKAKEGMKLNANKHHLAALTADLCLLKTLQKVAGPLYHHQLGRA